MKHWLYDQISNQDNGRKPGFSVRAITNWFRAVRLEIESAHGKTVAEQVDSCREFYRNNISAKTAFVHSNSETFEHLFYSVIYCMTVDRLGSELKKTPWIYPTVIVDWYYAVYFSIRSMLPIFGHKITEDHAKTARFVASTFRKHLPYPFDMLARRTKGEDYEVVLNGVTPNHYSLNHILHDRANAQGMLAQYLSGTAAWYAQRTKQNILAERKLNISNFRGKHAKAVRDSRLTPEIGFLHCAYRQRTKANYRDAIYLSYDYGEDIYLDTFIYLLSTSAKFASVAAIACIEQTAGRRAIKSFVEDLSVNIRGIDTAKTSEKYWLEFQ